MRSTLATLLKLAPLAASLAACGRGSSPITAPENGASAVPVTSQPVINTQAAVNVLSRTASIGDLTVTKVIGPTGGTITVPSAGLTLVVPPLAVGASTTFQVHVLPGSAVAYEFEPHGMKFPVPLIVTQNLAGTLTPRAAAFFEAGYFSDKSQINFNSVSASVLEELPIRVGVNGTLTFSVSHFSGYLVSSGRR